jgi:hypothetical protein
MCVALVQRLRVLDRRLLEVEARELTVCKVGLFKVCKTG